MAMVCGAMPCGGRTIRPPSMVGFGSFSTRFGRGPLSNSLHVRKVLVRGLTQRTFREKPLQVQMKLVSFTKKWWENGLHSNMKDITSAQELVDSLLDAGNKLVIVHFFSPGCGGCKALHPKLCQFGETNPEVIFLQVNQEEHRSMCHSLNVHVLPFFRFYRGSHGHLCSFSCTNATIKKFKDALAKHNTERCRLGPVRGLEESELLALAANKELSFNYTGKPEEPLASPGDLVVGPVIAEVQSAQLSTKNAEDNSLVTTSR